MTALRNHQFHAHGIGTISAATSAVPALKSTKLKASKPSVANAAATSRGYDQQVIGAKAPSSIRRVSHRFKVAVEPLADQRNALDRVFLAPEFCMYLMLSKQPPIHTRADAQLFLLQHKQEIDGYLPPQNRTLLRDVLADFVLEWSRELPRQIRLKFECLAFNQGTDNILRLPGIGNIKVNTRIAQGEFPKFSREVTVTFSKEHETYDLEFFYEDVCATLNTAKRDLPIKPAQSTKARFIKESAARQARILSNKPRGNGRSTICPLCGKSIPSGNILMHKHDEHGESMYSASTTGASRRTGLWVAMFQGGAPGLGKGKS